MTNETDIAQACAEVEEVLDSHMREVDFTFSTQKAFEAYRTALEHITDSVVALMEERHAEGFEHGRRFGNEETSDLN